MEGDGRHGVRHADKHKILWQSSDAKRYTSDGDEENGIEQSATDALGQEDTTDEDTSGSHQGRYRPRTHANDGALAGYDDASILQSEKGDEEADTHRNGVAETWRDGVDDGLAYLKYRQEDEDDTLDEYRCKSLLPSVAHNQHKGIGKEGVRPHARSQGKGQLSIEGHHQGSDSCRDNGGRQKGTTVHARLTKNLGIDSQNIRHCQERGQSCHQFHLYRMFRRVETQ